MQTPNERTNASLTDIAPGPVFVTGGTGKTGRRVVQRLRDQGISVHAGSRGAQPAFDWEHPEGWPAALAGSKALYITYAPDLAVPGAVEAVNKLVGDAKECGVERIVLLSGRGEPEAQAAELVVQRSGLEWTIVRCAWFMQNFDENYLIDGVLGGEIALPVGAVGEPFIDADDIADVVVASLTESGHAGQLYELTGPRTLTMADAAKEIGEAIGREVRYLEVDAEDYSAGMRAAGLPDEVIWLLDYLFATVLDGRNAWLADGVQRALGRPPRDFRDYAREAAASGVWDLPS